jgi:poly(3-hydroxybutyrate) depolymerase
MYEWTHAALAPARATADLTKLTFTNPLNPLAATPFGKQIAAGAEVFERMTRRYGKPAFGLEDTLVGGTRCAVSEEVLWERPFCKLLHFKRDLPVERSYKDPKVLLVAPMSGPLRNPAARHRRSVLATPRCLHHRLGGCARRATGRRQFRSG